MSLFFAKQGEIIDYCRKWNSVEDLVLFVITTVFFFCYVSKPDDLLSFIFFFLALQPMYNPFSTVHKQTIEQINQ